MLFESAHDKTYNRTRVTNKVSRQLEHPPSMAKILVHPSLDTLRKHAYSNILEVSPPKTVSFLDKNSDIKVGFKGVKII